MTHQVRHKSMPRPLEVVLGVFQVTAIAITMEGDGAFETEGQPLEAVVLVELDTPVHELAAEMQRLFAQVLDASNATFNSIDRRMAQQAGAESTPVLPSWPCQRH